MSALTQPWRTRREIPDPQVRDAADQFESARQLLFAQPPGSGLLSPLMNAAAIAIELYLKCLSADKIYTEVTSGRSRVSAKPSQACHVLSTLLDKVGGDMERELHQAFRTEVSAFRNISFRDALKECEGVFEKSRYPFEPNNDLTKYRLGLLMACSHFLRQFVAEMQTREIIEYA
jgi:hypothetical protein